MLLLALVSGFFLLRDDSVQIIPRPDAGSPSGGETSTREDAAAQLLQRLQAGLTSGNRREVVALAAPGNNQAAAEIGDIFDNARELGLKDLSFRYVDENEGSPGTREWGADVQMSWRIARFDKAPSMMEVPFVLAQTPSGAAFVSVGHPPDRAVPLWLLGDLDVQRSRRALVMVAGDAPVDDFFSFADQAVADVRKVLPRRSGTLVVEVPSTEDDLERVVGAENGAYQSIAAVTTTVDGSLSPSSPAHILINPEVFGRLGDDGAQIVVSHEATHVATSAATSTLPMWLLEGFADYVALAHVDLPVSRTASQILAKVRRAGPPNQLPGVVEFDPANAALGSSYESAWLACRFIGAKYGEQRLIEFYDAVDGEVPVRAGFKRYLDTDQRAFTSQWQGYLRRLAS